MDSQETRCLSISLRTDCMKKMITFQTLRCSGFGRVPLRGVNPEARMP